MVLLLAAGCAGPRPPSTAALVPTRIGGLEYVSLHALCQRHQATCQWNRKTHDVTVQCGGWQVHGQENSPVVTVNGLPQRLTGPLVIYHRTLMAPRSLEDWLTRVGLPAPPTQPTTALPSSANQIRRIMLDPGHGGQDPGAAGPSGVREKDIVLDIAKRLRDKLVMHGMDVYMTRDDDTFIPLTERTRMANDRRVDLFLSIHGNASRNRHIYGVEAYYLREKADGAAWAWAAAGEFPPPADPGALWEQNRTLKAILWDLTHAEHRREAVELGMRLCRSLREQMQIRSRGVRGARFHVLRTAAMPAVLLEVGYLTNPQEETRLHDAAYRDSLAEALAAGIRQYAQ